MAHNESHTEHKDGSPWGIPRQSRPRRILARVSGGFDIDACKRTTTCLFINSAQLSGENKRRRSRGAGNKDALTRSVMGASGTLSKGKYSVLLDLD